MNYTIFSKEWSSSCCTNLHIPRVQLSKAYRVPNKSAQNTWTCFWKTILSRKTVLKFLAKVYGWAKEQQHNNDHLQTHDQKQWWFSICLRWNLKLVISHKKCRTYSLQCTYTVGALFTDENSIFDFLLKLMKKLCFRSRNSWN